MAVVPSPPAEMPDTLAVNVSKPDISSIGVAARGELALALRTITMPLVLFTTSVPCPMIEW